MFSLPGKGALVKTFAMAGIRYFQTAEVIACPHSVRHSRFYYIQRLWSNQLGVSAWRPVTV